MLCHETGRPNQLQGTSSIAVQKAADRKEDKYGLFMTVARFQYAERVTQALTEFLSCIMSHTGEVSSGFFRLIEVSTSSMRRSPMADPLRSGFKRAKTTALFRTRAKDAFAVANAKGFGRMMIAAVIPRM